MKTYCSLLQKWRHYHYKRSQKCHLVENRVAISKSNSPANSTLAQHSQDGRELVRMIINNVQHSWTPMSKIDLCKSTVCLWQIVLTELGPLALAFHHFPEMFCGENPLLLTAPPALSPCQSVLTYITAPERYSHCIIRVLFWTHSAWCLRTCEFSFRLSLFSI